MAVSGQKNDLGRQKLKLYDYIFVPKHKYVKVFYGHFEKHIAKNAESNQKLISLRFALQGMQF